MRSVNFQLWVDRELWTLHQAVALVLGLEPTGAESGIAGRKPSTGEPVTREHIRHFNEIYTQAIDAIELKKLAEIPARDGRLREPYVRPVDFLAWAVGRGLSIPDALHDLVPPTEDKPVSTKERTTLLTIVALLAKEAKIDLLTPSKAATQIVSLADAAGVSLGETTVAGYLKKATAALESRKK